ncbi:hypothetical protein [Burkholderia territorii]|uniref:hypothetical protein n=1 Tax=Burkholderia territorii TaxID=1503055 RepID=UPI0012D89BF2|nr:hypothetical protein [Burkholderia territorii]
MPKSARAEAEAEAEAGAGAGAAHPFIIQKGVTRSDIVSRILLIIFNQTLIIK